MESLIQASHEQWRGLQLAAEQNRQQAAAGTEQPAPDFVPDLLEGDETEAELAQEEQPLAEGDQPQEEPSTEQTVVEEEPEVTTAPVVRDTTRRSEEHTSELQSRGHLVCRLLLEKKKKTHENDRQPRGRTTR